MERTRKQTRTARGMHFRVVRLPEWEVGYRVFDSERAMRADTAIGAVYRTQGSARWHIFLHGWIVDFLAGKAAPTFRTRADAAGFLIGAAMALASRDAEDTFRQSRTTS